MFSNLIDIKFISTAIIPILSCPAIVGAYKRLITPSPVKINRKLRILNKHCDEYLEIRDQYRSPKDEEYIAYKKKDTIMRCITNVADKEEREIFTNIDMNCKGKINFFNLNLMLKYLSISDDKSKLELKIKKFKRDRRKSILMASLCSIMMIITIIIGVGISSKESAPYGTIICLFYAIVFEVFATLYFAKILSNGSLNAVLFKIKEAGVYSDIEYTD